MLGQILLLQAGRAAEARDELAAAVALFEQHEGATHPEATIASGQLGQAEIAAGDRDAGRARLDAAIKRLATQVEPGQAQLVQLQRALAKIPQVLPSGRT